MSIMNESLIADILKDIQLKSKGGQEVASKGTRRLKISSLSISNVKQNFSKLFSKIETSRMDRTTAKLEELDQEAVNLGSELKVYEQDGFERERSVVEEDLLRNQEQRKIAEEKLALYQAKLELKQQKKQLKASKEGYRKKLQVSQENWDHKIDAAAEALKAALERIEAKKAETQTDPEAIITTPVEPEIAVDPVNIEPITPEFDDDAIQKEIAKNVQQSMAGRANTETTRTSTRAADMLDAYLARNPSDKACLASLEKDERDYQAAIDQIDLDPSKTSERYIRDKAVSDLAQIKKEQEQIRRAAMTTYSFETPSTISSTGATDSTLDEEIQKLKVVLNDISQKQSSVDEASARRISAEAERLEAQKQYELEQEELRRTTQKLIEARQQYKQQLASLNESYYQEDQRSIAIQKEADSIRQGADSVRQQRQAVEALLQQMQETTGISSTIETHDRRR